VILAGDIGGTRARLALYEGPKGKAIKHDVFESRAYPSLEAVALAFLGPKLAKRVKAATFGIAGPVIDQRCTATNFPWVVDARVVSRKLGIRRVTLLNDLVALAFGALTVPVNKIRVLHGPGAPRKKGGNLAVIAAGTGLGEAALLWDGEKHLPLATEGGHADFAARNALEQELFTWLSRRFGGHVSWERVVAGPGFSNLYDFFRDAKGVDESREIIELVGEATDRNLTIAKLGVDGKSEAASRAVDLFARIYGAETGNLVLKTLASAGVYVAGGIAGNMAEYLARGPFIEAFLDKGRFRALLETIPVAIVLDSNIGLAGSRYHAATAD
jgi:glucokinase